MKRITNITRKDICDLLSIGIARTSESWNFGWSGTKTESDFLSRLYDLRKMPTTDPRRNQFPTAYEDIVQHRENNRDWDDCWVFYDSRFNLMNCDDNELLLFLAEIFHPAVRSEESQWMDTLSAINDLLKIDGYEIVPVKQISGRDIYGFRDYKAKADIVKKEVEKAKKKIDTEYFRMLIELMYENIDKAPFDAIGKAKELIETCCIEILTALGESVSKTDDMTKLANHTLEALNLKASKVDEQKKGAEQIKRILGSLNQITVGITELRNLYGSGHGKGKGFSGLTPRHARLAAGSAANLVNFLWETYELLKAGKL